MTWPTTPVSTTNLDAGSDEPRLARADLKSAVDNVNAIAAEFGNVGISAPANNQVLKYNGSQWTNANAVVALDDLGDVSISGPVNTQVLQYNGSHWVNANVSSGGGYVTQILQLNSPNLATNSTTYVDLGSTFTELYAGSAGVTNSSSTLTFSAGTYFIEFDSTIYIVAGTNTNTNTHYLQLWDDTASAQIVEYPSVRTGDTSGPINYGQIYTYGVKFQPTVTTNVLLRKKTNGGISSASWPGGIIKITKLA